VINSRYLRVSGLVTSLSSTSFTFSFRTCISAITKHSTRCLLRKPLHTATDRLPRGKQPTPTANMSKRSGVPNGVEKAAKEVVQQPSKYTLMMRSANCALLTTTSPGQASPPSQCPKPRPLQLGPRLPPRRLHHPHERFLRRHVHSVLLALLPWSGSPDRPPVDGFGAHAVWHAV
jgi:hypothetical protein